MIINHNMLSANANRQLGINNTNFGKATEKLSSGLRINRAGDDAAGLSISEKMRGQIRGLDQASTNAQDGISLIQTAEGALDETHSILQRMRELSVQAGNSTTTVEDRSAIQEEINQLTQEIDRISGTTEFNTKKLLDGSFDGTLQIGANSGQTMDISIGSMSSNTLGLTGGVELNTVAGVADDKLAEGTYTINDDADLVDASGNIVAKVALGTGTVTLGDTAGTEIDLDHAVTAGSTLQINKDGDVDITLAKDTTGEIDKLAAGDYKVSGTNLLLGDKLVGTVGGTTITLTDGTTTVDATALGLAADDLADGESFTVKGVDVTTEANASGSTTTIDAAIQKVSEQRSKLGAVQNRLEHTIKNLNNASENLQSAESRIRDVDMAKEMMNFTKNQVLQQASQAMLAQANQVPSQVLSLLR